jgi:hypothetical protein
MLSWEMLCLLAGGVCAAEDAETGKWGPISEGVTTELQKPGKKIGYTRADRRRGLFRSHERRPVQWSSAIWGFGKACDQGKTFARGCDGDAIGGRWLKRVLP